MRAKASRERQEACRLGYCDCGGGELTAAGLRACEPGSGLRRARQKEVDMCMRAAWNASTGYLMFPTGLVLKICGCGSGRTGASRLCPPADVREIGVCGTVQYGTAVRFRRVTKGMETRAASMASYSSELKELCSTTQQNVRPLWQK